MSAPVKVPAEVERPDQLLGRLNARQLLILTATALGLYLLWQGTRGLVSLAGFAVFAIPTAALAAVLALARRDGLSLDAFAAAAIRHYSTTRTTLTQLRHPGTGDQRVPGWITRQATTRRAHATRTPTHPATHLPATGVGAGEGGIGMVNLGGHGLAVVAVASTVNLALRAPEEQEALIEVFARYLHSLTAGTQILVRTIPVDLTPRIRELRAAAPTLPHPALMIAAQDHAQFLAQLVEQQELLCRQVLVIFREPNPHPARTVTARAGANRVTTGAAGRAHVQLAHRLAEATALLAPAGITLTPLDSTQAAAILAAATHPARHTPAHALAPPDAIITTQPGTHPAATSTASGAEHNALPTHDDDPEDNDLDNDLHDDLHGDFGGDFYDSEEYADTAPDDEDPLGEDEFAEAAPTPARRGRARSGRRDLLEEFDEHPDDLGEPINNDHGADLWNDDLDENADDDPGELESSETTSGRAAPPRPRRGQSRQSWPGAGRGRAGRGGSS